MKRMLKARNVGPLSFPRLTVALLLLLVTLTAPAQQPAPRDPREAQARGFIDSVAALTYAAAWPTATYRSWQFDGFSPTPAGFNVIFTLHGLSYFDKSDLWVTLQVPFANGTVGSPRVLDHNALIAPPFQTSSAIASLAAQLAQQYAASNAGTSAGASAPAYRPQPPPTPDVRQQPTSASAQTAIQDLLESWRKTIVANDAIAEAALYAPVVASYYGRSQVSNAAIQGDKAAFIDNGNHVLGLTLDDMTFESLTPNTARVQLVKNVTWEGASGNTVHQLRVSHIDLQRYTTGWKITGERDGR